MPKKNTIPPAKTIGVKRKYSSRIDFLWIAGLNSQVIVPLKWAEKESKRFYSFHHGCTFPHMDQLPDSTGWLRIGKKVLFIL